MRAQTTLDFSIGITVFLAVIVSIFAFAPGILTPFTVTGQTDAVTTDRTADYLAQDLLASQGEPYLLDRGCTVAFFNRSADERPETSFANDCQYEDATLNDQLGFAEYRTVNVTIIGNITGGQESNQLYWNEGSRTLDNSSGFDRTKLAIGDDVDIQRARTAATRVVTLNGQDVIMRVVVT
jgi:hypothetical protein